MTPSPTKPSAIREEFEKDLKIYYRSVSNKSSLTPKNTALWAARWMAEYLVKEAPDNICLLPVARIRQLAKDLDA